LTEPMSPDHGPALLSEEAAASKCGISLPTFQRWIAANCIEPMMAPGAARSKLYRLEDIEAFARTADAARSTPSAFSARRSGT